MCRPRSQNRVPYGSKSTYPLAKSRRWAKLSSNRHRPKSSKNPYRMDTSAPIVRITPDISAFRHDRDQHKTGDQAEMLKKRVGDHDLPRAPRVPEIVGDDCRDRRQYAYRAGAQPHEAAGNDQRRAAQFNDDRYRGP